MLLSWPAIIVDDWGLIPPESPVKWHRTCTAVIYVMGKGARLISFHQSFTMGCCFPGFGEVPWAKREQVGQWEVSLEWWILMARDGAGAEPGAGCTRTCGQVQLLSMPPPHSSPLPREVGVVHLCGEFGRKRGTWLAQGFLSYFSFRLACP